MPLTRRSHVGPLLIFLTLLAVIAEVFSVALAKEDESSRTRQVEIRTSLRRRSSNRRRPRGVRQRPQRGKYRTHPTAHGGSRLRGQPNRVPGRPQPRPGNSRRKRALKRAGKAAGKQAYKQARKQARKRGRRRPPRFAGGSQGRASTLAQSSPGRSTSTRLRKGLSKAAVAGIAFVAALLVVVVAVLIIVRRRKRSKLRAGSSSNVPFPDTDEVSPPWSGRGSSSDGPPSGSGVFAAEAIKKLRGGGSDPSSEREVIRGDAGKLRELPPVSGVGEEGDSPVPSAPPLSVMMASGSTVEAPEIDAASSSGGQPSSNARDV